MTIYTRLFLLLTLFVPGNAIAQPPPVVPQELKKDKHVVVLLSMLEAWKSRELVLPRKETISARFEKRLQLLIDKPRFEYQTRAWADKRRVQFREMPQVVKPQLRLSPAAEAAFTLAFVSQLEPIRKRYDATELREELGLPLFLILGDAQQRAMEGRRRFISSNDVFPAMFAWWTNIWPLCPLPD